MMSDCPHYNEVKVCVPRHVKSLSGMQHTLIKRKQTLE